MQVSPEDRPTETAPVASQMPKLLLAIALLLLAAGGYWMYQYFDQEQDSNVTVLETLPEAAPVLDALQLPKVDIPVRTAAPVIETVAPPPLPALADSDTFTRAQLLSLSADPNYHAWLQADHLLERAAAIIDSLSRGRMLKKLIPVTPLSGKFIASHVGGKLWLDTPNFVRYDEVVNLLASLDARQLTKIFDLLRPLLESAYGQLGYPEEDFGATTIRAIDVLLATPDVGSPIELKLEGVLYTFADPALEKLPSAQKQLLRMGPENAEKIKRLLRALRKQLLRKQ